MLIAYKRGQGSIVLRVKILNSSVATGAGLTGLTEASAGMIVGTIADNEATTTRYRASSSEIETISTLGTFAAPTSGKCRFKEVDATNHPGVYEIQIADARFAVSSAKSVLVSISGATNAAETDALIPLTDHDPYDVVRGGMTALPNVVSGSAGAVITSGTGTAQLSVSSGLVTLAAVTHTGAVIPTVSAVTGLTASNLDATISSRAAASDLATVAGYLDTEIAAILADTNELQTDWANGGRLDNILDARASQTSVDDLPTNAELSTALAAADDATLAAIAALNNLSAAQVNAEVDTALADANLDHLVKIAVDTDFNTTVHQNSVVGYLASTSNTYDRSTDSQEAIRNRGDAAWVTATGFSTHTAADVWAVATRVLTAGTNIQLPSNGLANVTAWTVALTGNITGNLSGSVGSVTGNVGGNVTGSIGSLATQAKADVNTEADTALTDYGALKPTTAGRTLDVAATGEAGLDFDNIKQATGATTLANIRVPVVTLTDTLATYTGNTPQTGDAYARIGAPAGASVSADVAAVKTDTGNLVTRITSTLFSGITSLAQWLGLLGGKQTGDSTARTEMRATGAGSGTFDETTDSQEAIRDRGDSAWITATGIPTASAIADAVWDEAIADHMTPGTYGYTVTLAAINVTSTLADTNELQTDWANGGRLDLILDARASQTSVDTLAGYVDTEVAAIKAKTDNLPSDPADASDIAASFASLASTLSTIASYIDTEVAAIKAKTDTLPAAPAATGDIPTTAQIATALLAKVYEGTRTVQDYLRLSASVQWGKASGLEGASPAFRDDADTKARVSATYAAGARGAPTLDAT